jgi:hypothetical protein
MDFVTKFIKAAINVHGVNDDRQKEMPTAEPLVTEPSSLGVKITIEKLKRHKSPDTDQIPVEMIRSGGNILRSENHKRIISIWKEEELPQHRKESIVVLIYKKGDETDYNNYRGVSVLPTTYKMFTQYLFSRLTS